MSIKVDFSWLTWFWNLSIDFKSEAFIMEKLWTSKVWRFSKLLRFFVNTWLCIVCMVLRDTVVGVMAFYSLKSKIDQDRISNHRSQKMSYVNMKLTSNPSTVCSSSKLLLHSIAQWNGPFKRLIGGHRAKGTIYGTL